MCRLLIGLLILCCYSHTLAATAEQQANSFANIYATTCLKYLPNLEELRHKLGQLPALTPEQAMPFLNGKPGKAWPVPDAYGTFVVALTDQMNLCAVYARRVNATLAKQQFERLVATAPAPLTSRQLAFKQQFDAKNGNRINVAYQWQFKSAPRKMLFMLTTADADTAALQGMATASMVH